MKKLYCIISGKYRIFEKSKILYPLEKKLVFCITCNKYKNEGKKLPEEEEPIEILKIIGLIENIQLL